MAIEGSAGAARRGEAVHWALVGACGAIIPFFPVTGVFVLFQYPAVWVGLIALHAVRTLRLWRRGGQAGQIRNWIFATWVLSVGPLFLLVLLAFSPPAHGALRMPEEWPTVAAAALVLTACSAALAAAAYAISRRIPVLDGAEVRPRQSP